MDRPTEHFIMLAKTEAGGECTISIHALNDTPPLKNWKEYFMSLKKTFLEKSSVAAMSNQYGPVADEKNRTRQNRPRQERKLKRLQTSK